MSDELGIGMLSGARRDGVSAVLVTFSQGAMELLHAKRTPYPVAIARTLEQVFESVPGPGVTGLLDEQLGKFYARAAQDLVREAGLEMRDIAFIGARGQAIWQERWEGLPAPAQLGNGKWIARNTGVVTVAGFHRAGAENGGQGTPLAPLLHRRLFHDAAEDRAVLDIGSIARLSLLPAEGGVSAFDTGPGNCLLDAWAMRHLHRTFDEGGRWAASGTVDRALLARMLDEPWLGRPPPKSAGPGHFDLRWLDAMLDGVDASEADVQATLAELTVQAAARSLPFTPCRLLVCGGGAYNADLLTRLEAALPGAEIETTAAYGVEPGWLDGLLFAWLARERLAGRGRHREELTGSGQAMLPGDIFDP